jgi:hypothetical protein
LRKKFVETYSSMPLRRVVIIVLRKLRIISGTWGVSMLFTANFLKISSVFFYQMSS